MDHVKLVQNTRWPRLGLIAIKHNVFAVEIHAPLLKSNLRMVHVKIVKQEKV